MLDAIVIEKFNGAVVSDGKWSIMELKKNTAEKINKMHIPLHEWMITNYNTK